MKTLTAALVLATLAGCASTPTSSNPPPSEAFTAVTHHTNPYGSQELARREAVTTCKHWNAVPRITASETINRETGQTVKDASKELAKKAMEGRMFKKDFPIQTTITYVCMQ